jgi:L-ribulose-5-phosphate 3-epimerase UlaE
MLEHRFYKDFDVFLTDNLVLLIHNKTKLKYLGNISQYQCEVLKKVLNGELDSSYCYIKETFSVSEKPRIMRLLKIIYSENNTNYELLFNEIN